MTRNICVPKMEATDDDQYCSSMFQDVEDSLTDSIDYYSMIVPFLDQTHPHCTPQTPHTQPNDRRLHYDSQMISLDECSTLTSRETKTESRLEAVKPGVIFSDGQDTPGGTFSSSSWSEFRNCSFEDQHSLESPTLVQDGATTRVPGLYTDEAQASGQQHSKMSLTAKLEKTLPGYSTPANTQQDGLLGDFSKLTIASTTRKDQELPEFIEDSHEPAYSLKHELPRRLYLGRGVQTTPRSSSVACSPCSPHLLQTDISHITQTDNCVCPNHGSSEQSSVWCPCRTVECQFTEDMLTMQDEDGDTLLQTAIIQELYKLALDIIFATPCYSILNLLNNVGQTALHLAVLTHQPRLVRMLVSRGARLDTRDRHGNTALHLACRKGCLTCAKELTRPINHSETTPCKYQVPFQRVPQDPSMLNYDGQSYVHLAADSHNMDLLDYLVSPEVGYSLNVQHARTGRTVLHEAVCKRNITLLRHLLKKVPSLDVNTEAFDGLTALQLALNNGNDQCARLLRQVVTGNTDHAMDTD